jgi:hypothetical protein
MINLMNIVALIVGILFGYWCFGKQTVSWIFVILHTAAFSSKNGFNNLYDMADDKVSYEWYIAHNKDVKTYADYLKLHADARPSAYETFKNTYDALKRSLVFRILPIALSPAILFWSNWYFYLIGVAITAIGLIAYEIAKNGFRPGFYQRLAIYTTLSTYAKSGTKQTENSF